MAAAPIISTAGHGNLMWGGQMRRGVEGRRRDWRGGEEKGLEGRGGEGIGGEGGEVRGKRK